MKPSLLIMAAGMGSRYGGLKQVQSVGPDGSVLLDYSIYDALKAGFGKIVFIIRRDIEKDFKEAVGRKWEKKAPVCYVFQELGMVPEGFRVPEGREKPWGTGHAIWVAQNAIREPFAVINADDFYGRESFQKLGKFLRKIRNLAAPNYAMVGFSLSKTLSRHGTVSRGICQTDRRGFLKDIVECLKVGNRKGRAMDAAEGAKGKAFPKSTLASMNIWGFTPRLFSQLGAQFQEFLNEKGGELKSEFLIPRAVEQIIFRGQGDVKMLTTRSQWFGMTYPEDLPLVRQRLAAYVKKGVYPPTL
jgi:UTP-glucose-1-phosphate uridylyltransferase